MMKRRTVGVIVFDLLLLAELCVAIYFANENQEEFTLVFLKVFFGLVIPTVCVWRFVMRKLCGSKAIVQGD